jgi:hypothetical protein
VKLQFLNPLYARPGPLASVCLDTSRDVDDPDRAIELRRRSLRHSLLAHDADQATVDAIADAIGTDRDVSGRHGQALFAAQGRLLLAERLPEPPARDFARYGMLPAVLPLALQHAPDIPYAAVSIHRVHAAEGGSAEDELEVDYDTGRWPMSRVAPDRHASRRTPVDGWPKEAEQLLGELADSVDTDGTELIVLSGDPWASNTVTRLAPRRLHDSFVKLKEGGHRRPEPGRAILEAELDELLADKLPSRDQQQLDAFLAQRARRGDEIEGLAATVAALQRGQAQAVVLNRPVRPARHLWVGTAPTEFALSGADLNAFGVPYYWEEPAGEALIRAAVGTQAELIVMPQDELPLDEGLAVLLRYTGT